MKTLFIFCLCGFAVGFGWAQKDTSFWFAAPDVSSGLGGLSYDQPVVFRFSTYDAPAVITLSQPANAAFLPQTLALTANTSGVLEFPPFFNAVENTQPNTVLNRGFLIQSDQPITAYYEVIGGCQCNPEIFSLKGNNALGTDFYIPFQTYVDNSPIHNPLPFASFNVVATEHNTLLTITPSKPIIGHAAGVPFQIALQKGQTWVGQASSQLAVAHPSGTRITANKPIAVTVEDDLLVAEIFGGSCRDMMGDQIVPVNRLGQRYVVQKGFLAGTEKAFVVGTQNGTNLQVNGIDVGNIAAGETFVVDIAGGRYLIEGSEPVYVLQMTGNGCEIAGEILPPIDCSGSSSVRFVRPTDEPFWLFLVTKDGNQDDFVLNGNASSIQANQFVAVPGTSGEWVAAVIPFLATEVPSQFSSLVENTAGVFQMGLLCGRESVTGARFGYFSDFSNKVEKRDSVFLCAGDSLTVHGTVVQTSGTYVADLTGLNGDCDTVAVTVVEFSPLPTLSETIRFCAGDTAIFRGFTIIQAGVYFDTLASTEHCDTLLTVIALEEPLPNRAVRVHLCPGESTTIAGVWYDKPFQGTDTLRAMVGCDTVTGIIVTQSAIFSHLPDTVYTFWQRPVQLPLQITSKYPASVQWIPKGGLNKYDAVQPMATLPASMGYQVVIRDSLGCELVDSIWVKVEVPFCPAAYYVPNAFMPDDDGVNDIFTIFTEEDCISKVRFLQIQDRWGELVFERKNFPPNDLKYGWDGTFRQRKAAIGHYVYVAELEYFDGRTELVKGGVTLLRCLDDQENQGALSARHHAIAQVI